MGISRAYLREIPWCSGPRCAGAFCSDGGLEYWAPKGRIFTEGRESLNIIQVCGKPPNSHNQGVNHSSGPANATHPFVLRTAFRSFYRTYRHTRTHTHSHTRTHTCCTGNAAPEIIDFSCPIRLAVAFCVPSPPPSLLPFLLLHPCSIFSSHLGVVRVSPPSGRSSSGHLPPPDVLKRALLLAPRRSSALAGRVWFERVRLFARHIGPLFNRIFVRG